MTHSTPSAMSREAIAHELLSWHDTIGGYLPLNQAERAQKAMRDAANALNRSQPDTVGGKPGEGEVREALEGLAKVASGDGPVTKSNAAMLRGVANHLAGGPLIEEPVYYAQALRERADLLEQGVDLARATLARPVAEEPAPLTAPPALDPTREALEERSRIARIIDPNAFQWPFANAQDRDLAYAKAGEVLAVLSSLSKPSGGEAKIAGDKEHILAVGIHHAMNGDPSLLKRLADGTPASLPVNSEAEREGWKPGDLALNARYERDGVYPAVRETAFVQHIKISHGRTYLGFGPDGGHTYLSDQFDKVHPSAPTPQQGLGERADG